MSSSTGSGLSRRELIAKSSQAAVASALAGLAVPQVHAAGRGSDELSVVGSSHQGKHAASDFADRSQRVRAKRRAGVPAALGHLSRVAV